MGAYHEGHSTHAPLLAAVRDLYPEAEWWARIPDCDINKYWSATVIQNRGALRYYFCELAASFDLARGEDHGLPLRDGWWRTPIEAFSEQIRHFCPGCGIPARLKGHLDREEFDTYTASNADLALKARARKREVTLVRSLSEARQVPRVTDFSPLLQKLSAPPGPMLRGVRKLLRIGSRLLGQAR